MHIKRITIDGHSISASDLAGLHDGQTYPPPDILSAASLDSPQQGEVTSTGHSLSLSDGYTLRIAIANALVEKIRIQYFRQTTNFREDITG